VRPLELQGREQSFMDACVCNAQSTHCAQLTVATAAIAYVGAEHNRLLAKPRVRESVSDPCAVANSLQHTLGHNLQSIASIFVAEVPKVARV
jgi:hypothetical protein